MGQLLSNVSSLLMNDIDSAADKDRPKEKLETEFSSPAREYYLLPDPRSATENVDRTPIYATRQSSVYKPETDTPRPRYLETDMDNVLGVKPLTERVCRLRLESSRQKLAMSEVVTSTPVARATPIDNITAISEQASQESLRFSDTGHCEVVTSENTDEIVIQDESVEDVSIINDELVDNSTASNWSGIGGPDHSLGPIEEFSEQQYAFSSERDISITESLIVHKDSFDDVSAKMEEWDSPVTNDTNTPKMTKNAAPRTPLGDVSKNSLHVTTNKQSNKPPFGQLNKLGTPAALQGKLDEKTWRTAQDERIKICTGVENTPPRLNLATYPLDVVQSAPGRLNTKQGKKLNARWANDSLVV